VARSNLAQVADGGHLHRLAGAEGLPREVGAHQVAQVQAEVVPRAAPQAEERDLRV
jgi:hypothetical protein